MNLQSRGLMGHVQDSILFNDNKANIALGKLTLAMTKLLLQLKV
jgi:hypothetical protein